MQILAPINWQLSDNLLLPYFTPFIDLRQYTFALTSPNVAFLIPNPNTFHPNLPGSSICEIRSRLTDLSKSRGGPAGGCGQSESS